MGEFSNSWLSSLCVLGDVHKFPSQKERRVRIFGYPKCTFFTVWTSTCTPNQCWVGTKSSPSVFHLLEPFIALDRPGHRPEYERWCAIALKLHLSLLDGPYSALQEMGQAAQIRKMGARGNYGGISKFPWFRRQCQGNAIISTTATTQKEMRPIKFCFSSFIVFWHGYHFSV